MQVEGDDSGGAFQVRADKTNPDIVFVTVRHAFKETWTAEDGRWFTLSGHWLEKDIKATHVAGTLYEFTFHLPGRPFTVTDSSGKLVSNDRGNISQDYTFDFGSGTFTELSLRISGPHPAFDVDLCQIVKPLVAPLGSRDSAQYMTPRPIGSTDSKMGYDEYLPPSYDPTGDPSPLLLFFHGSGESGDGSAEALSHLVNAGIPKYINVGGWPTDRPFVVLAPQHFDPGPSISRPVTARNWADRAACSSSTISATTRLRSARRRKRSRPSSITRWRTTTSTPTQVYLTGLSCGAYGIWEYLAAHGADHKVAAAVPIAGDGRPGSSDDYCKLDETPLWAFHGAQDDVVNPLGSIDPLTALQGCPGVPRNEAKLTVFDDRDHNSWDPAYGGAAGSIYDWMLGFTTP